MQRSGVRSSSSPPSKGQTCSGFSFAPVIPSVGGASRSVRIQTSHIFVDFSRLTGAFPSQISVHAKVVLRTEARFHAGLLGGGLTSTSLTSRPFRSNFHLLKAAIACLCVNHSSGNSRRMKNSKDNPTGMRPAAMSSASSGARRASLSAF